MLNKLKKKYGKKKLIKFLIEMHPHLNSLQKKTNFKYLRTMNFGAAAVNPDDVTWITAEIPDKYIDAQPQKLRQYWGKDLRNSIFKVRGQRSGNKNFINRSEYLLWKYQTVNDPQEPTLMVRPLLEPSYHAMQGGGILPARDLANLFKILFNTILSGYYNESSQPEYAPLHLLKNFGFIWYLENYSCFIISAGGIDVFRPMSEVGVPQEELSDPEKQQALSELIILMMRIFDMIHDFIGERTKETAKKGQEAPAETGRPPEEYLSDFIKNLIEFSDGPVGISVKFYSFSFQKYYRIYFRSPPVDDPASSLRDIYRFPNALKNVIQGLQGERGGDGVATIPAILYMKHFDSYMADILFHFNLIVIGKNNFQLRESMLRLISNNGVDTKSVILEDVPNMYQKISKLSRNTYIAPSNFTDANATTGAKRVTAEMLRPVITSDGKTAYFVKRATEAVSSRPFGKVSADKQQLQNLDDLISRQIWPQYLNELVKNPIDATHPSADPFQYNTGTRRSVVSCYHDTKFKFVKNARGLYMELKFNTASGEPMIHAYTGVDYATMVEVLDGKGLWNSTANKPDDSIYYRDTSTRNDILNWDDQYNILSRAKAASEPEGPPDRQKRFLINLGAVPEGSKCNVDTDFARWLRTDGNNIPGGGTVASKHLVELVFTSTISRTVITKNADQRITLIYRIRQYKVINEGFATEQVALNTMMCIVPRAGTNSTMYLFTSTLSLPGVSELHEFIQHFDSKIVEQSHRLNTIAQITTLKFYGDASQAQTPFSHLGIQGSNNNDDKSVLLIQGDTPSTFISAIQNEILPMVAGPNAFRKCNVLGGSSSNSGYGGLFTLPALDLETTTLRTSFGMERGDAPFPSTPPRPRSQSMPSPQAMSDSPETAKESAPRTPETATGQRGAPTTAARASRRTEAQDTPGIRRHKTPSVSAQLDVNSAMTQLLSTGIIKNKLERLFKIPLKVSPMLVIDKELETKGDKKLRYGIGISEERLFEQLGILTDSHWQQVVKDELIKNMSQASRVSYINSVNPPLESLVPKISADSPPSPPKAPRASLFYDIPQQQRTAERLDFSGVARRGGGTAKFGKKQWYVDGSSKKKLYRVQRKGSNANWVTPQYYKKITGKSFWKLPVLKSK